MNISCSAEPCPIILDSTCVFYTGANLIYTGINTNDNLEAALIKIDNKFRDAGLGYAFNNGIIQTAPGQPVKLGGKLIENTVINSGIFAFSFTGTFEASALITTGGTNLQFVKGDGSLDSLTYQIAGNYISALTGDGTATGPGSAVFTLANTGVIANTYGSSTTVPIITVDSKGRVTNLTSTTITSPSSLLIFAGDVTGSGNTGSTVTLTLLTVNPNVYASNTFLKFAVNGKGLVTSAAPITNLDIEAILGYIPVPSTRTLTINGVTQDLTVNRSWTISAGAGTVSSVGVSPGTGISASVANPTTTPVITITNTLPDQIVSLSDGTGISVTGTYPNFTITATGGTTPTLQQVTDQGRVTTNDIEVDYLQTNGDVFVGKLGAGGAVEIDDGGGFVGRIDAVNLTTYKILHLPDALGTFAMSVNGVAAAVDGSITIPIGTGTVTGTGVATRVAFWSGTSALSSNTNLYWDDVNSRLGLGTATPAYRMDVNGGGYQQTYYTDTLNASFRMGSGYELYGISHALGGYEYYITNNFGFASAWQLNIGTNTNKILTIASNLITANQPFTFTSGWTSGQVSTYQSSPYTGVAYSDGVGWNYVIRGTTGGNYFILGNTGALTLSNLSGTGTRMVVASSTGVLSTQTIPSGGGSVGFEMNFMLMGA